MPAHHSIASPILRELARIINGLPLPPRAQEREVAKLLASHPQLLDGFVQDLARALADYQVWDAASTTGII